jgi:NAD(P)-dependent dehydrogenase (short-subunit alcohol dehydrogenase family)
MTLNGKTILITGATDGVGRYVAEALGRRGANILVHGRDRARGEDVVNTIRAAGGTATFYRADLASLAEARTLAETVLGQHQTLDMLINNAGIGTSGGSGKRELSHDGYELRFAVNYLAGFLLARLLLPRLVETGDARIVHVASLGQQAIDFDDVMLTRGYDGRRAYCQSKLAQIMFTFDLAQELDAARVTANCLHPATYMNTTMVRKSGVSPISTIEEGGEAILNLAASPQLQGKTGLYYNGLKPARADAQAYDLQARERLRKLSLELTGLAAPAKS